MKTLLNIVSRRPGSWCRGIIALLLTACLPAAVAAAQQQPQASNGPVARISAQISGASRVMLAGSLHPLAQSRFESGRVPSSTRLSAMVLHFRRSAQSKKPI